MTRDDELPPELRRLGLEPDDLDGHTIEELSDYLDADRTPADPSIEGSPGCQLALQAMRRLRALSHSLMDADVAATPAPDEGWIGRILEGIALDARAGRRIPLDHADPTADLAITEGAVRGLIRAAETDVEGTIIGRCRLTGDLTAPGAPVTISVDASVLWGENLPGMAERLRAAILRRVTAHTDLTVEAIDITVYDIHRLSRAGEEDRT